MVRERYISDNPFRLLCLASSESYASLRRKADGAARAAQVGLAPEIPLDAAFGGDLSDLQSRVRSLATDPEGLTLYRLLWPLAPDEVERLLDGAEAPNAEGGETPQLLFLRPWYAFVQSGRVQDLKAALAGLTQLGRTPGFVGGLAETLIEEGSGPEAARRASRGATTQLVRYVAERGMATVEEEWRAERWERAREAYVQVRNLPLDEADEEAALAPLLAYGDLLVSGLKDDGVLAEPCHSIEPSPICLEIEALAAMVGRHPSVGGWLDAAVEHRTDLAANLRSIAIDKANDSREYAAAFELMQKALELEPDEETCAQIRRDLHVLRDNMEEAMAERQGSNPVAPKSPWPGIAPLYSAPSLYTVNGVGSKMYGAVPFERDRRFSYSTQYFVFLFLPIFPIARYVVQRDGDSYRFFGAAPWSKAMKIHMGITATLAACAALAVVLSSALSTSANTAESSASVASSSPEDATESGTEEAWSEPRDLRREEIDRLRADVSGLDASIQTAELSLAILRTELNELKDSVKAMPARAKSQKEVDLYNAKVDKYEGLRKKYNAEVTRYEKLVKTQRQKVDLHNQLVSGANGGENP